jgi:hypothetical protein
MNYATFASASEATRLANLTKDSVWVGVTDIAQEGVFKNYNDGTIVGSFMTWVGGQPSIDGPLKDCVVLSNNLFSDQNCEKFKRVLCEIQVVDSSVSIVENLIEVGPPSNLFDFVGTSGKNCENSDLFF